MAHNNKSTESRTVLSIAYRLQYLLKEFDLTVSGFARNIGVSRQTVHKWLKGGAIHPKHLMKIATYFDINSIWLVYGVGSKSNAEPVSHCRDCDVKTQYIRELCDKNLALFELYFRSNTFFWHKVSSPLRTDIPQEEALDDCIARVDTDYRNIALEFYGKIRVKRERGTLMIPLVNLDKKCAESKWFTVEVKSFCGDQSVLCTLNQVDVQEHRLGRPYTR